LNGFDAFCKSYDLNQNQKKKSKRTKKKSKEGDGETFRPRPCSIPQPIPALPELVRRCPFSL
jgi:hypothetical protein